MGANDNGGTSAGSTETGSLAGPSSQFDEMSLSGGSVAVALGMVSLDAAHSLALAMQNAVVEQQNAWIMQRTVMAKAMDQLLRNDAADRAMDLMLRLLEPPAASSS